MKRFPFSLLIVFLFTAVSCNLQYYSLKQKSEADANSSVGKNKERIKVNFIRRMESGKNHMYNSFLTEFELSDSNLLDKKRKSALTLSYSTTTIDNRPGWTGLWFLITLGILPALSDSSSIVYFDFVDARSGKLVKDYKYRIDGWGISSWATIPFALTLPLVNQGFAKSVAFESSEQPQKLIMKQFHNDLTKDFEKNKELYEEMFRIGQETIEEEVR